MRRRKSSTTTEEDGDYLSHVKDWAEIAKNLVEAVALVVAGLWTYRVFVQKEAPALQRHASSGGTFEWTTINDDTCEGSFYPSLKNDGVSAFDVARVRLRLWTFAIPSTANGEQSFVNQSEVENTIPSFDRTFTDGAFVRHYPPGEHRSERYSWFFAKVPARNVLVRVDFFATSDQTVPEWSQYYWRGVCSDK